MSATKGGADVTALYKTPTWCVDALLPHLPTTGIIVDAGCGDGAIISRVAEHGIGSLLVGVEIVPERAARTRESLDRALKRSGKTATMLVQTGDFLAWAKAERADLVIQNPSFGVAEEFFEAAIELTAKTRGTVATLLRASWHIPECRASFGRRHPFDIGYLRKRPSFAASLKCGGDGPKRRNHCDWAIIQQIDAPKPAACPGCGKRVDVTTNDSADYAWFITGPGRGGRFFYVEPSSSCAPDLRLSEANGGQP